ncbi:MAG: TIGR00282 family metallophosphoesterase [Planctomycetota bacterium]
METKILVLGDVVGKPGRRILQERLRETLDRLGAGFCIVNGENAAGGSGITPETAKEIFDAGVDVITTGDHVWKQKEAADLLAENHRILRPANLNPRSAGVGHGVFEAQSGVRVGVANLLGRVFMNPSEDPFRAAELAVEEMSKETNIILIDIHGEATSEKIAMGWFLDGKVSAVFGTHTHVQTADERVLPGGTAYITDLGMTGPHDSILGRRTDRVLEAITTGMPKAFDVAKGDVRMCGAVITVDAETGRAAAIERVVVKEKEE